MSSVALRPDDPEVPQRISAAMVKKVESSDTHVLTSWKEVAAYLGKGVRTVQRWERELSLPVRRPYGLEKHVIVALPEELDHWMRTSMQPRGAADAKPAQQPATAAGRSAIRHAEQMERLQRLIRVMTERTEELNRRSSELLAHATALTRERNRAHLTRAKR